LGTRWYAVALLGAPLAVMAVLLPLSLSSTDFLPALFTTDSMVSPLLIGTAASPRPLRGRSGVGSATTASQRRRRPERAGQSLRVHSVRVPQVNARITRGGPRMARGKAKHQPDKSMAKPALYAVRASQRP
jgi:hypothetical protein